MDGNKEDFEKTLTSEGLEPAADSVNGDVEIPDEGETAIFSDLFCPVCGGRFPGGLTVCNDDGASLIPVGTGDDLSGTVLNDKYVLVQLIGRGGFGNVYRATHRLAKTEVAIKVIKDELRDDDKAVRQFLKETRALMSIQSMNVVTVHDVDRDAEGRIYIVMELLRGRDLEDCLKIEYSRTGRIPWEEVGRIVLQVCDALECAHEKGIVHRDLKPGNVMMVKGRGGVLNAKVVDFGIASLAQSEYMDLTTMDSIPRVIGTPSFMSPEQAKGQPVDLRADLYSLGAMIYRLVCGVRPFDAKTDQGMLIAHVIEKPRSIRERCPELEVPPEFDDLVMNLMAKAPDERPADVPEVVERLSAILPESESRTSEGRSSSRCSAGSSEGYSNASYGSPVKIVVAAVALLLFVAAGVGVYLWLSSGSVVTADASAVDAVESQEQVPSVTREGESVRKAPSDDETKPVKIVSPVSGDKSAASGKVAAAASESENVKTAPGPDSDPMKDEVNSIPPPVVGQAAQATSKQTASKKRNSVKASPMKAAIPVNRSASRKNAAAGSSSPSARRKGGGAATAAEKSEKKTAVKTPTPVPEPSIKAGKTTKHDVNELEKMEEYRPRDKKKKSDKRTKLDSDSDAAFDELNF